MDYSGFWQGRAAQLNVSISLATWVSEQTVLAVAKTTTVDGGWRVFGGTGKIEGGKLFLELTPKDDIDDSQEGGEAGQKFLVELALSGPDYCRCRMGFGGDFSEEFPVQRQWDAPPSELPEPSSFTLSTQEKNTRVPAIAVDLATLRQIYQSLVVAAEDAASQEASIRSRELSAEAQAEEEKRLRFLYQVAVTARGDDGDQVIAFSSDLLAEDRLPKPLAAISFEIGLYYRLVNQREPNNRAQVKLDFSKPPLFDLSKSSGGETPNSSVVGVAGNATIWVAGTYEKVHSILRRRRVRTGWLHWRHTFDILLLLLGFPLALPVAALVVETFREPTMGDARWVSLALFLLLVPAVMFLFRLAFGFARWLLPYAEFSVAPAPIHRQLRLLLASLIIGVLASLVASAVSILMQ